MKEFVVNCPNCGVQLSATDEYIGHKVSCPECGTRFVITGEAEQVDATYPRIEAGGQIGRISHGYVPSTTSHTAVQGDSESGHVSNVIKIISAIAAIAVVGYNIWVHFHNARIRMEGGEYQYTVKNIVTELVEKNLSHDGVEIMKVHDFAINGGGKDCKATIDVRDKRNGNLESLHCTYKVREIDGGKLVEVYDFKFDEDGISSRDNEHMSTIDELKVEVSRILSENISKGLKKDGYRNVSVTVKSLSLTHDGGNRYLGNVEVDSEFEGKKCPLNSRIVVVRDTMGSVSYELNENDFSNWQKKAFRLDVDELKSEVSRMLSENISKGLKKDGYGNVSVTVDYVSLTHGGGEKYYGRVEMTCRYDGETETIKYQIEVTYDGETIAYELKTDE